MAVLDLPDPLQSSPSSAIAGTDDLLAQMAGDEIDRLLAEADVDAKADAAAAGSHGDSPTPDAKSAVEPEPDLASELDRVLDTISDAETAPLPPPQALPGASGLEATSPVPMPLTSPHASAAAPSALLDDPETSAAERAALGLPDVVAAMPPLDPKQLDLSSNSEAEADGELPFFLRPLEWLNAPMAACPEPIVDAIGKVAILTLVNAIAVLVYVLFFRKH